MTDLELEMQEMDPIEAEVHAIRQQINEIIKDMTPEEEMEYFRNSFNELVKEGFRFKVSKLKPAKLNSSEPYDRGPDEVYSELEYYVPTD